jgi:16S rRNA (cytosine1402-N4)-methyltransferase
LEYHHATVLTEEVARLFSPLEGVLVLDGTLGGGGHAEALLAAGARVLGLDRDPRALVASSARLSRFGDRFACEEAPFGSAREVLDRRGIASVDRLLLDLGVSSPQLDEPERGFSFSKEGPIDMRMGTDGESAFELLSRLDEDELAAVLEEYGEEPFARRIARAIKRAPPRTTTTELADLVGRAIPRKAWPTRIHPATRTFQALRIAVNRELEQLDTILARLPELLGPGGRAAVLCYHSLEDRRVKQAFRDLQGRCTCPPGLPVCACGAKGTFRALNRKAVHPTDEEIARNPRARSARLRAVERLPQ